MIEIPESIHKDEKIDERYPEEHCSRDIAMVEALCFLGSGDYLIRCETIV